MKNTMGRGMVLALGVWFAAVFSAATTFADSPKSLVGQPVDELIRLALENNPGIKVAEAQVQVAQAELVRQRAEVAMKVSEAMARWHQAEAEFKGSAEEQKTRFVHDEVERELRALTGADVEKKLAASASPAETHKASLEIRIGRYGELTWEVKGLPIPEELCHGSGHVEGMYEIASGMWWLKGPEVTAKILAPLDINPDFVSGVVAALRHANIESFSCVPTTEHMALPTIDENLRTIGEALQHSFKENVTGKVGPSELEAFLKEFQIPTANLKTIDREMTYRLQLFVSKNLPNVLRIAAVAALPGGVETGNLTVIEIENGVLRVSAQSHYGQIIGHPRSLWAEVETIFSKSVKVPAAQPASGQ